MVSKTLSQSFFKVCVALVSCGYMAQVWSMHQSDQPSRDSAPRASSGQSVGRGCSSSDAQSSAERLPAALKDTWLDFVQRLWKLEAFLLSSKIAIIDGKCRADIEETFQKMQGPRLNYFFSHERAARIKDIILQQFQVTIEKLNTCSKEKIREHIQAVCNYYLHPRLRNKRMESLWDVFQKILKITNEQVLLATSVRKDVLSKQELEAVGTYQDELASGNAPMSSQPGPKNVLELMSQSTDSASPAINWLLDLCIELKNRRDLMQKQTSLSSSSSSSSTT